MKSRWNEDEAAAWGDDLGLLTYASRLLGSDPSLVLHGGGNSSVKVVERDVFGDPVDVLHVKGSGWDMATIERAGFAPLRLGPVARLADLDALSDARMANELKAASLDAGRRRRRSSRSSTPRCRTRSCCTPTRTRCWPSPTRPTAATTSREVFGDSLVVVPYVMPGFVLAKLCAELFPAERHDGTVGMVLLNHGLFTFADDARTAYENHVELVARALAYVEAAGGPPTTAAPHAPAPGPTSHDDLVAVADLRRDISAAAGQPMVLRCCGGDGARRFAARPDLESASQVGPATPDHVLRTKRVPLVGRDVGAYVAAYEAYVERNRARLGDRRLVPVDPAPRVVVDPGLGVLAAGRRVADAVIAADVYEHTIGVIERAVELGGYAQRGRARHLRRRVLGAGAGQARPPAGARRADRPGGGGHRRGLGHRPRLRPGAAGRGRGRGRGRPGRRRRRGGRRPGLHRRPGRRHRRRHRHRRGRGGRAVLRRRRPPGPQRRDVPAVCAPRRPSTPRCGTRRWTSTPAPPSSPWPPPIRSCAGRPAAGGSWSSGRGTCPRPARARPPTRRRRRRSTQLARVAALEWADDGIRVNVVHPDAVFDTGVWSDEVIAQRAASYGLSPEQYRTRNLLEHRGVVGRRRRPGAGPVRAGVRPHDRRPGPDRRR